MSFLVDPPLLVGSGAVIGRLVPDRRRSRRLKAAVLAIFLVTSISLYLDAGWTAPIWRLCRARSGRDWMLNSGVWSFDEASAGLPTHLLAASLFLTYPAWLHLGAKLATRQRTDDDDALEVPSLAEVGR